MTAETAIARMPQSPVLHAEISRPGVLRITLANPPAGTVSGPTLFTLADCAAYVVKPHESE